MRQGLGKYPTILLTGAGGAPIPELLGVLRRHGFRVLTADMDPMAPGLYLADKGFVIPAGKSPSFLPFMRDLCRREGVDVLVSGVDEELLNALELERSGVAVLLPRRPFLEMCLDKYDLMQRLTAAGISVPRTRLASAGPGPLEFPLVIKPRRGRGSRGFAVVQSEEELTLILKNSAARPDNLLLQNYLEGPEYTVSVVVWRDGQVQSVVPKEIICKRGITRLGVTRKHSGIDEVCRQVQETFRADGPMNVQLILDRGSLKPTIFEINPRFSTTVTLTMAAGVQEVLGLALQALYGRDSYRFGDWEEGVVLLRQTLDTFLPESEFRRLAQNIQHWEEPC